MEVSNSLDEEEVQLDLRCSLEQEWFSHLGDETCILHRTYSLQFSYKIGTRVAQASQEILSPFAMHNTP